jgi:hypothetical protein
MVTTLLCAYLDPQRDSNFVTALYIMENHSPAWPPTADARWATRTDLSILPLQHEWQRPIIERWLDEEESGSVPALRPPWSRKGWVATATQWVDSQLSAQEIVLHGALVQVKQWDISSVWRASTSAGDLYFKATPTLFAHEPRVTLGLARLFPDHIPAPAAIATYPDQGWMLLRSFEGDVLWEPTLAQKEDVLRIAARMQVVASTRVIELLAIGCADSRLHRLPARVAALLRDDRILIQFTPTEREQLIAQLPDIEETCARLATGPVPQTLMHGDLHGGNVAFYNGRYTIFDWTDACITHPFFDLVTFLRPTDPDFAHLRDVYLTEWLSLSHLDASLDDLRATFDVAYHLGGLHHALSYHTINAHCEPPMVAEFEGAIETFVRHYLSFHR